MHPGDRVRPTRAIADMTPGRKGTPPGATRIREHPTPTSRPCDALGLEVVAHDPYVPAETMAELDVRSLEAEELLRSADLLSVHLPSTRETENFVDERRLSLLQPGAIVVITSRGDVYDAEALERALRDGHIAAAGLDVFPEEPLPPDHPLTDLENIVLTPHVAGYSEEAIKDLHETAAAILEAIASGRLPPGALNGESARRA